MSINERVIFDAAVEISDPEARLAFVDKACEGDTELQTRVLSLLKSHTDAGSFLEIPATDPLIFGSVDTAAHTILGDPTENDDNDRDDAESNRVDLSFLTPSTKVGSIGAIGHYEILKVLGQGGFGIVFRAFDEKLHRHVAIKTMSVQMAATSPPRKRFLREARAAAAIRHENVVQVYSVEEQPLPYLVMEFIDGQTLQQKQRDYGPLELPELLHVGRQIAAGLAAAHAQSLIHRDVKPGNILLEQGVEQKVKITDFGLARAADDASLTRSGMISGTPLYMAPEQALGGTLDGRSDLFSLGSVLYELATGRPPFRAPTTVAVLRRVVDDTPRPIQEIIPETPDWLVAIINKLLEKNPDDRYQTAQEIAGLLARCQSELQLTGSVTCVNNERAGSVGKDVSSPALQSALAKTASGKGERVIDGPWFRVPHVLRHWFFTIYAVSAAIILPQILLDTWHPVLRLLPGLIAVLGLIIYAIVNDRRRASSSVTLRTEQPGGSRPPLAGSKTPDVRPPQKLTAKSVLYALFLGVLVMSPILYGRHLSRTVNAWLWPAIPTLPVVERAAGLRFDGKDDYVQIPVDWSYPQFTIDAFVTSAPGSDNGNIVHLSGGGKVPEWMGLNDGPPAPAGQRVSGAQILGKTPYASAYAPFAGGVRQHRVLVFNGSHLHYYVNGIWQGKRRAEARDGLLWKMQELRLGSGSDGKRFFEGQIDQLRVSKVARYDRNFPPVTSVAADEATLSLYNFEEGTGDVLKDVSGNNKDGKIYGATWVHSANGLQFDGVDDYVELNGLGWNSNQYTIEAYISQDGEHGNLFQAVGPGGMLQMYLNPQAGGVGLKRDDVYQNVNGSRPAMIRQHLALVYDGQNLNYFVQGHLAGTKPNVSAQATPMPLNRMIIGTKVALDPSKPEFFEGRLEQLRVSKTVRYVLPFKPGELSTDDSTLALYDFTTGEGDVIKDSCGKSPDGEIIGATWVKSSGVVSAPRVRAVPTNSEGLRPPLATDWSADAPPLAIAPFDAAQAKAHQEAWAKYLGVPIEYTNSIGMKFVLIPPGEFTMGSTVEEIEAARASTGYSDDQELSDALSSEGPQHKVVLTQPYYLATTELSQAQFMSVVETNPSRFQGNKDKPEDPEMKHHPVENLSWNDVADFCAKLSDREGYSPVYRIEGQAVAMLPGDGYRMPREAQWEFACRAGTTTPYWFGDRTNNAAQSEWATDDSAGKTHTVGSFGSNPFGLYDMHGNVREWCQDGWNSTFYYSFKHQPAVDPISKPQGPHMHMVRGGTWEVKTHIEGRSAARRPGVPSQRYENYGCRISISVQSARQIIERQSTSPPAPAIAPFNAEQAKQHQAAWAQYLNLPVEYTNTLGMKFMLIPPGEFTMGSTAEEIEAALSDLSEDVLWTEAIKSEVPSHKVIQTQPIYLGVHEVTQAEYQSVIGGNPSYFAPSGDGKARVVEIKTDRLPVDSLSWNDAVEFCAKLSEREGHKPVYFRSGETVTPLDGIGYRLPTEAEWEFSCRAGATTKYWFGDKSADIVGVDWVADTAGGRTHAVGELRANPFGLFDMQGNVWEWMQDGWDATYYGQFQTESANNPSGPSPAGLKRMIRGGSFDSSSNLSRASARYAGFKAAHVNSIGFRVALPVDAVKQALANHHLLFDGVDDEVRFSPLRLPRREVTIEAWAAPEANSVSGEVQPLWQLGEFAVGAKPDGQWVIDFVTTNGHFMGVTFNSTQNKVALGQRVHLAAVITDQICELYVDGRKAGSKPAAQVMGDVDKFWSQLTEAEFSLGSRHMSIEGGRRYWKGSVSQVRISSRARYSAQFEPAMTLTSDADTIALYDFSQGRGDVLKDISGNGHDGKFIGATWVKGAGMELPSPFPVTPSPVNFSLQFDGKLETHVAVPSLELVQGDPVTLEGYFTPQGQCYNREVYQNFIGPRSH